ncbi:fructose-specific PTS transporter subunit EIIC [Bacillus tianshenii]|nr:fructose-specific PTS transporter subunit EIIC [Bacillus tianshenii]
MKITDLLKQDTMILELQASTKAEAIDELVEKLDKAGRLNDREQFKEAILTRESQSSTGIGEGVAIPHAKVSAVKTPAIAFARSQEGVDYEALDGQVSHLFFMIAASEGANNEHLETLSRLSTILMDTGFRQTLLKAESTEAILQAIEEKEKEEFGEEETEDNQEQPEEEPAAADSAKILAVTACPTGIAHTFMAAKALEEKAKEMDVDLKVETNGSSGAKNVLTSKDIEQATAIIVAADKQVEMERFKGKHVIQVPVADGIHKPQQLIERALQQDAQIFQGGSEAQQSTDNSSGEKRTGFYKHLMSGVSNMLPFVVGGGLLIAISFFWGIETDNPFAQLLGKIGGENAFMLMVPVLAAFIAQSIADRPGFAPGMVGGLIAYSTQAGFLGGLIAGFFAGYLMLLIKRLFKGLPESLDGLKPVLIYPLFGIFITGLVMYGVAGPISWINTGLQNWLNGLGTGNLVLLGLVLGGMMAVDMGGPINKAAFTFGIAMIDAGNYAPHAAIMAGGMVPPLGLALATTIFKNKFNQQEREAGKTCYAMGISFITEGAIPFAAADPARVIPSCIAGSAVAGALAMLFGIGLPAPHGGIFVIPIVTGNPFLYLLAILIGAAVTALLVGFLKKPAHK